MLRVLVLLASVLGLVSGHPLGAQTCDPAGEVKFVCGHDQSGRSLPGSGRPLGNRIGTILRYGRSPLRGEPS